MSRLIVNVDVPDLAEAIRFYTHALDLRVGRRFADAAAELLGGEVPIYLLVAPEGTAPFRGAGAPRAYGRHWTPVHLDFAVDDVEAAVRRAVAAGAAIEAPVEQRRWGKLAILSDPFGHGLCLLQFEGRGYDEIATDGG